MALYYPLQKHENRRYYRRKIKVLLAFLLVVMVSLFFLIKWSRDAFLHAGRDADLTKSIEIMRPEASFRDLESAHTEYSTDWLEGPLPHPLHDQLYLDGEIGQGESIYQCLRRKGISDRNIQLITENLNPLINFRSQSQPGDIYRLSLTQGGEIEKFEYQKSPLEIYCLGRKEDNAWNVWRENIKVGKYWICISGKIKGSLVSTFQELGYPVSLALQLAEILEWKIDFQHEVRDGDRFNIVFERFFRGDELIGDGRILAVMYEGQVTGSLKGFYFNQGAGGGDYYNLDGISLRQAFLKAPLSYKYISSGFNYRRKHPILGGTRPHLGIDFAAPYGSPVWAVADGVVLSKSYDKNNGNQVKLKHMNGYITYYNHLCKFAKGLKKGKRVVQKQIIGYVGTSGLSTGLHLDYRVKKDGRFINPLKAKYPSGKPLQKAFLPEFKDIVAKLFSIFEEDRNFSRLLIAEVDSSEISHPIL